MDRHQQGSNPAMFAGRVVVLSDQDEYLEAHLEDFRPDRPNTREVSVRFAPNFTGVAIYAYRPEPLEELAAVLNRLAGEMRADRTAFELDQAAGRQAVA